jgi:hypothetical protein
MYIEFIFDLDLADVLYDYDIITFCMMDFVCRLIDLLFMMRLYLCLAISAALRNLSI